MPITDEELSARLISAQLETPVMREATAAALVAAARVAGGGKKRRSFRLTVIASLAAAVIAVPTAAYAIKMFEAQTGRFVEAGQTENVAGDEFVDFGASDLPEYVAAMAPTELPVPDGFAWDRTIERVTEIVTAPGAEGTRSLILRTYEHQVWVAWIDEWVAAHDAGDLARERAAIAAMRQAEDWPALNATDGGGIIESMRLWTERMADGDAEAAQALAQYEGAASWDGVNRDDLAAEIIDEAVRVAQGGESE